MQSHRYRQHDAPNESHGPHGRQPRPGLAPAGRQSSRRARPGRRSWPRTSTKKAQPRLRMSPPHWPGRRRLAHQLGKTAPPQRSERERVSGQRQPSDGTGDWDDHWPPRQCSECPELCPAGHARRADAFPERREARCRSAGPAIPPRGSDQNDPTEHHHHHHHHQRSRW